MSIYTETATEAMHVPVLRSHVATLLEDCARAMTRATSVASRRVKLLCLASGRRHAFVRIAVVRAYHSGPGISLEIGVDDSRDHRSREARHEVGREPFFANPAKLTRDCAATLTSARAGKYAGD